MKIGNAYRDFLGKSASLSFFEALTVCSGLLFFYATTYARFLESTALVVLLIPLILVIRRADFIFWFVFAFCGIHRYLTYVYCHENGVAWFDQIANMAQTLNALYLNHSIYTAPTLVDQNFSLYLPVSSVFLAACQILTGLHFRFFLLMIPWGIYGALLHERKNVPSLVLFLFLNLNEDFLHQSAKLGNNELHMAFAFFALWAFVHPKMERWHWIPVTLLAWFKQTTLLLLPFYWIYLFKKDRPSLVRSFLLCAWIFIFYLAGDFSDFYHYGVERHEAFFPGSWFEKFGSLIENFSVTTLLNALGYSPESFWNGLHPFLSKLRNIGFLLIFARACFAIRSRLDVLKYFAVAFVWFFFFTKGFVFARYWVAVLLPISIVGLELQKNDGVWKEEGGSIFLKGGSLLLMGVLIFAAFFQLSHGAGAAVPPRSEISPSRVLWAREIEGATTTLEDVSARLTGDENNPFESQSAGEGLVIEFGSPVSLASLEITGVRETKKNPYGICQTLTDFNVDVWSGSENKFKPGIQIRNCFFNDALDPLKIRLEKLPSTSKILLRGIKCWEGAGRGFVIRSLKFYSKDSSHP